MKKEKWFYKLQGDFKKYFDEIGVKNKSCNYQDIFPNRVTESYTCWFEGGTIKDFIVVMYKQSNHFSIYELKHVQ